jgi:transcriptional regulator with XRE-family HTH domain
MSAQFLDTLIRKLELKNDSQLARKLKLDTALISRIRSGKMRVTERLLARASRATDLTVNDLDEWL